MIRLASLSIISASVSSRYRRINYRRCRAEPAKQFSPEAGRLPGPIEAYRSLHLEYSIPPAIFRNGYSIFTMVDKRTGEPRAEKKKKFEIGGVWSFSKYSTVKRGMLPREWSISRLQERRRRTTKHICLRIACYFRYISKFFPLWIYSMAILVELLKNNFDTGKIRKFFVYVRINIRILIIRYESESSLNRSRLFLFFSSQSRSISLN